MAVGGTELAACLEPALDRQEQESGRASCEKQPRQLAAYWERWRLGITWCRVLSYKLEVPVGQGPHQRLVRVVCAEAQFLTSIVEQTQGCRAPWSAHPDVLLRLSLPPRPCPAVPAAIAALYRSPRLPSRRMRPSWTGRPSSSPCKLSQCAALAGATDVDTEHRILTPPAASS